MGLKHNAGFPPVKCKMDSWGQDNQYVFRTANTMLFLLNFTNDVIEYE